MSDTATSVETAKIILGDVEFEAPALVGSEDEKAFDISKLRATTGWITLDEGYRNTGSVRSGITFINGEAGILRYRGYEISDVSTHCNFLEVALLLMHGELPSADELSAFTTKVMAACALAPQVIEALKPISQDAHPMAQLSAALNAAGAYEADLLDEDADVADQAARLIGKTAAIAAAIHRTRQGLDVVQPDTSLGYAANFLYMFTGEKPAQELADAFDNVLILHADHEQNCSTASVRMVGSSGANLFASCAAGVCALWGPLHGGANVAVLEQLQRLHEGGVDIPDFMERVKRKEDKLFGFGHGVYKNYDPRAKFLKGNADTVLAMLGVDDPFLAIAKQLEEIALGDDYFVSRKLFPNVDFYSGIIMRAMGIPVDMFTVMFALGRMPGWIAQFKEVRDGKSRIYRPRQVYVGPELREVQK